MRYTLIIALFLLTACDKLPMTRKTQVETIQITWIKETPQSCAPVPSGQHLNACATTNADYTRCTVRMPEDSPDWIVAEEMKHCFGWVH